MFSLKDKTILITGGTGSFGNKVAKRLLEENNIKHIVIASRDEKKQHEMRLKLGDEKLSYKLADIRDERRINEVMKGIDLVFHAAALKYVPSCEYDPYEAVKTNIIGSNNVFQAAINNSIEKVVALSTDKSVYPINTMGISKAMMERLVMGYSRNKSNTVFCAVRYGNVMCSRGSVIPLFLKNLLKRKPILITEGIMTRFLLSLEDAVDLVEHALNFGENGEILVRKAPACKVIDLLEAIKNILGIENFEVQEIGIREGEKMHETLVASEEFLRAKDENSYYKISSSAKKSYFEFIDTGINSSKPLAYTSENTTQLDLKEIMDLLNRNKEFNEILREIGGSNKQLLKT